MEPKSEDECRFLSETEENFMKRFPILIVAIAISLCLRSLSAADEKPAHLASGRDAQQDLMVTVYNNGYGLVREVRKVNLPAGLVELEFRDVAEQIDATSVAFKSITSPSGVRILEQNYRYDLLSPATVMNRFVGRKIRYTTSKMENNTQVLTSREGALLSNNEGALVQFDTGIEINPQGAISFGEVPSDLLSRPTLLWLLRNEKAAEQKIETSYLTNGMNWKADYVTVINPEDTKLNLNGWVTLENHSGASYQDAALKLVAGDVQRVQDSPRPMPMAMAKGRGVVAAEADAFAEKSFFEYHLYTLGRRTTVGNNETKQVSLLEGSGIPVKKMYLMESPPWVAEAGMRGLEKRKLAVVLEFENKKESGLGIALPKGRVRVYKADTDSSLQLVGEDTIDHTPKDEKLRLKMGEAFDVVAERSQTTYNKLSDRVAEFSYRIAVRNHKAEAITATVLEHVYGDWTITKESHTHVKRDSKTIEYNVPVAADGETVLTYTARVEW